MAWSKDNGRFAKLQGDYAKEQAKRAEVQADYIEEKKPLIDTFTGEQTNLQTQLNDLTGALTVDGEVIQARGGHPVLNERLNNFNQQLADKGNEIETLKTSKADKTEVNLLATNKAEKTYVDEKLNDISVLQINKNKGLIDQTYLSDELKQQITGTTPINAVPADDSITSIKLVDQSVTPEKTSFIRVSPNLMDVSKLKPNTDIAVDTYEEITFAGRQSGDYIFLEPNKSYTVSTAHKRTFYDANKVATNYAWGGGTISPSPNPRYLRVVFLDAQVSTAQVNEGTTLLPYEPFGSRFQTEKVSIELQNDSVSQSNLKNGAVSTDKMVDKSATYAKRSELGTWGSLVYPTTAVLPNIELSTQTLKLNKNFYLLHGNRRWSFNTTDITITLPTDGLMHYILFDTTNGTFRVVINGNETALGEREILIAVIAWTSAAHTAITHVESSVTISVDGVMSNNLRRPHELAIVAFGGDNTNKANFDFTKKTAYFPSPFYVISRNQRYDIFANTTVDLSGVLTSQYQNAFLFFDKKTRGIVVKSLTNVANTGDDFLLIATIAREKKVTMLGEYTIDGKSPNGSTDTGIAETDTYFMPEKITGHYEPDTTRPYNVFSFDRAVTKVQDFYNEMEALRAAHGDYITRTLLGNDSSGTYPIYEYRLYNGAPEVSLLTKKLPKIIMVVGVHGIERASIYSMYYLIRDICENWRTNPLLEYLRFNVEIKFIPIANPWAFENGVGRKNANGVDINRNFDPYWANGSSDPASEQYRGASAFSEVETQYIKNLIDNNLDALQFIDYHTNNSSGAVYNTLMWNSLTGGIYHNVGVSVISQYTIAKQTREYIKRYGQPTGQGYFGNITYEYTEGYTKTYASSKGVPAMIFECFRKFPNEPSNYSEDALRACTEYVGNFLLNIFKYRSEEYLDKINMV